MGANLYHMKCCILASSSPNATQIQVHVETKLFLVHMSWEVTKLGKFKRWRSFQLITRIYVCITYIQELVPTQFHLPVQLLQEQSDSGIKAQQIVSFWDCWAP